MAIKFIMVSYVFLKHKNHPIVGVFYTNYLLNQPTRRQLLSPHLNLSTESVRKFVETYSLNILNSNRFRLNQRFAQEIGSINFKNIFAYRSPYERF